MDDDDVQSVHEAAQIVEQRPAQAQHREHHQQWLQVVEPKVLEGLDVSGGRIQWMEGKSSKVVKGTSKSSTTEMRTVMRNTDIRKGVSRARPSNGDPSTRHCAGIFRLALKPRKSVLRSLQRVSSLQAGSFKAGNSGYSGGTCEPSVAPAAAV
eukprot:CAMPEP_0173064676 /NCGR_PEP_ID=MMETSP1102-20130122/5138_1 /TAXON_ID=49646 /ORGANISM="Geminigera sp., Strain Caron Lab Isolate" /LENGTH=152 /DNA_ID=CAMNT_0013931749 /DNA_START=78 /DNA_END=534 /DNA_ORIENTATION=+